MKQRIVVVLAVAASLGAVDVLAQEGTLEEIIVMAERRSENLQEVPVSVSVFSGDMINDAQIVQMADVAELTPNFKLTTFNIGEPQLYIRGIGNTSDSVASDPAVAVFIDDVYIGRPSASTFHLVDIERIEVLRGPQGTLYGKNATGGAIAIHSKKPSQDFQARVGLTAGEYSLLGVNAFLNGGFSDNAAGKLVVAHRQRNGYSKNTVTGAELDDEKSIAARGQLLFTPRDSLDVLLGFDYSDEDPNGNCRTLAKLNVTPQPFGGGFIPTLNAIKNPPRTCTHSQPDRTSKTILGLLGRVDWQVGAGTLTSITAYRESDVMWRQNLGGQDSPPNLLIVDDMADEDADQVSQEFRYASEYDGAFNWVGGVYYLRERAKRREQFNTGFTFPAFVPFSGSVDFIQDNETVSTAVFGQIGWDMTDALTLTLGARYTKDDKTITQSANDLVNDGTPAAIPLGPGTTYGPVTGQADWSEVTPRVSLDWRITDDHLLFLTYSEGFKSGGFPSQATSPTVAVAPLKPEKVDNYELGVKTTWFDNRFRFNASVFSLDYTDLQVFQLINLQLVTANAEKASVEGLELEFAAAITDGFLVTGSYGYMDSKYDNYVVTNPNTGTTIDNTGNKLARAPDNTATLAGNYVLETGATSSLEFNVQIAHTGDFFHEPSNDIRSFQEDGWTTVDAYAKFASSNWDVTLWGRNLSDELYIQHMITSTFGGAVEIYAPPRHWGATFNYYWD